MEGNDLRRRPCGAMLFSVLPLCVASCGYRALYATDAPRLHVKLVRTLVPDAIASDEVASGAREELARAGALEGGDGWPRVEIEVLRADETSEGVAFGPSGPVARGTGVAVVARAWIAPAPDAPPAADTGDVRAEDSIAVDVRDSVPAADPRASTFHRADALRAAARRLGRSLARRVIGLPAAE
jgi:hypothetical protein